MKKSYNLILFILCLILNTKSFAQTLENFNKPSLTTPPLSCWTTLYYVEPPPIIGIGNSNHIITRSPGDPYLSQDLELSLNDTTPITGTKSLHIVSNVYYNSNYKIINTPYIALAGQTISFNIRLNKAVNSYTGMQETGLNYYAIAGSDIQTYIIKTSAIGNVYHYTTTVVGAGGPISIVAKSDAFGLSIFNFDIDDFETSSTNIDSSNTCALILPIKLISFSALPKEKSVILSWNVSEEINLKKYEIENSVDLKTFNKVGEILQLNNYNYSFTHNFPAYVNSFYRLKIIDINGTFSYSEIKSVKSGMLNNVNVVFPNPIIDNFSIIFNKEFFNKNVSITILSLDGKKVFEEIKNNVSQIEKFSFKGLPKGIYLLKIASNKNINIEKIIVK